MNGKSGKRVERSREIRYRNFHPKSLTAPAVAAEDTVWNFLNRFVFFFSMYVWMYIYALIFRPCSFLSRWLIFFSIFLQPNGCKSSIFRVKYRLLPQIVRRLFATYRVMGSEGVYRRLYCNTSTRNKSTNHEIRLFGWYFNKTCLPQK